MPESTQSNERFRGDAGAQSVRLRDVPAELVWKAAAALAIALIVGLILRDLLQLLIRPVGILFAGVVVALTFAPLAEFLERWLPRMAAVIILYLGLIAVLVGMGFVIFPPIISQASTFIEDAPQYTEDVQQWISQRLGIDLGQQNMGQLSSLLQSLSQYLITIPAAITSIGAQLFLGFFVSMYWLYSMPRMKAFAVSLFPPQHQDRASELMHTVGQRMGGYLRGVVISGAVIGVTVSIGLSLLGVQYALLLGLAAFLGEFVPNIGPVLAGIPAVAVALFQSPTLGLIVLIFYVALQQIESYALTPVVMSRTQAAIPPLVTTFAVFAGFFAGGILWAVLSIPLSGAILTLTTDLIAPAVRRRTGAREAETGIRRQAFHPESPSDSGSAQPKGAAERPGGGA